MSYKKCVLFFVIQIAIVGVCISQQPIDYVNEILSTDFDLWFTKDDIDANFIKKVKKEKKVDLTLVNPGQEFNRTDVIIKNYPNKRLIVVGKNSKKVNFIFYENGGNALYNVCLIYKRKKRNEYDTVALYVDSEINSFEKLKEAIANKKFTILPNK